MSTLDTFMANLRRAVWNKESATIGGGEFNHQELAEVLEAILQLRLESRLYHDKEQK